MKISDKSKNYFYFSLEDSDWRQFGYYTCRQFLNAFQKEFKGGKFGERFWIAKMKAWAIKKSEREKFNRLLKDYFKIEQTEDMFL